MDSGSPPGWSWGNDKQTFGRFKLFSRGESHALGPAESGNLISMTFCFITILRGWTKDGFFFFCWRRRRRGYFGERVITGFFFVRTMLGRMTPEAVSVSNERFCEINLVVSLEGRADGAEIDCKAKSRDGKSVYFFL